MAESLLEKIKYLMIKDKEVYVNDLSISLNISKVSIRKYLTRLENQGFAHRFYGGASLAKTKATEITNESIYSDPLWVSLAQKARQHILDGDSIFIGSGRSCCVLARELTGSKNLTVVTNNLTALPDLYKNATRVYLIGGEVTSTDNQTLFSSSETTQSQLNNIFVNKAFTSVSGIDMKAGLTVDSIISTYIYKNISAMSQSWYLMADSVKFDKIAIYQIAELGQINTLITNSIPQSYKDHFTKLNVDIIT